MNAVHVQSYWPQGTVYGALLNFKREWEVWAPRMNEAPYKGGPKAPVLFIKTANTFSPSGGAIALPSGVQEVDIGANLAWVMGEDAQPVACVLMNDVSIPHESYYRPPVKYKCIDGFLGVGSKALEIQNLNSDAMVLRVSVNGVLVQRVDYAQTVRKSRALLQDIATFMTFQAGDVLMLGSDCLPGGNRPRAKRGDRVEISAPVFENLANVFAGDGA